MRHSSLIISFFVFLSLPVSVLFAQSPESEPLYFQTYTIEDGLSDNWVRGLDQDSYGYIWIATNSGISRYDGYAFERFRNDPNDPQTISSNNTNGILVDSNDNVWVGTDAGLNKHERSSGSFIRFQNNPSDSSSLPNNFVSTIYESQAGDLWIGTGQGMVLFNIEEQSFSSVLKEETADSALFNLSVSSIAESEDGIIYAGTVGGGIYTYKPDTEDITYLHHNSSDPNSLPSDTIYNLFIDQEQVLWVGYDRRENSLGPFATENIPVDSRSGLWKKNLATGNTQHYLYNPEKGHPLWGILTDIEQTDDGKLWFTQAGGSGSGLRRYDSLNDSFLKYDYEPNNSGSIAWNYTTAVFEDRFHNLWVGTSRGLSRADRNQIQINTFTPVPTNKYDLLNNLYGITEVEDNRFWITTDGRNIIDWDRENGEWQEVLNTGTDQMAVVKGINGQVWYLNSKNQIEQINIDTFESKTYIPDQEVKNGLQLTQFIKYSDNYLFLATNRGLWRMDIPSGNFQKIEIPALSDYTATEFISNLTIDSSGTIWFILPNTLLDSKKKLSGSLIVGYHPVTEKVTIPVINDSYIDAFGNGVVSHILSDSRNQLWVSKSNGLIRFDPNANQSTFYNQNDELRYIEVLATVEDDDGMIWMSTRYGISRLNPETNKIRNYSQDDGLQLSRMNDRSVYKRENGELMFGGVGGISYFLPNDLKDTEEPPLIRVSSLQAGENMFTPKTGKATEINWEDNSIDIEYISVNFANPEEISYSYKLNGFHDDWVDAGNRRNTQFSNLSPGDYTFEVKAVNAEGIESANSASILLSILPPWWRTWWAYMGYGFIFLTISFVAYRAQKRRILYKEKERAQEKELAQAREIEEAYENLKSAQDQLVQQEKLASLGQLTAGIAHEIKNPLNFVNNFSELSVELVEEVRDEIRDMRRETTGERSNVKGETEESPLEGSAEEERRRGVSDEATDDTIDSDLILDILDDIEANLKTIYKHGSRADSIVKSMLQHSRGGDGKMEPTPLNPLIKEYVNLAFHGMRAGDDPINVDIDLQLDKAVGEVPLVAEDFSRVIVNLSNNGFDAMREKESSPLEGSGGAERSRGVSTESSYQPKLTVRTFRNENTVTIEIEDNGPGIPDEMKDKIMQPFFTTKKGTQGTGLGLSITNDIVKAHGGSIDIKAEEGNGSVFVISLPTGSIYDSEKKN